MDSEIANFLENIGFRSTAIHRSFDHFDFSRGSRIILIVGPMGSGKTEFVTRVWRDAQVAKRKSDAVAAHTTTAHGADRRNIFIVKNKLDALRFPDSPPRSLSFRGGYIDCGDYIDEIEDSFDLERLIDAHPQCGIWIIDEAAFYDERIAFVMRKYTVEKELVFICPTLSLNFRKQIFNNTAGLLVEYASDVFPLTAYCEHVDCLHNAVYSYRYYIVGDGDRERPDNDKGERLRDSGSAIAALYFDPLIMVGGDKQRKGDYRPNYEARCATHHFLPGREYTYMTLRPYAKRATNSGSAPLIDELSAINTDITRSRLYRDFIERYGDNSEQNRQAIASLSAASIAERALIYLYAEANLIDAQLMRHAVKALLLDTQYMNDMLRENGRQISLLNPVAPAPVRATTMRSGTSYAYSVYIYIIPIIASYFISPYSLDIMKHKNSIIRVLVSQNIKRSRKAMRLTQTALGVKCELSTSFIAEIELCRKFPSPEVLERIAKSLNLLPYQLFLSEEQWHISDHVNLLRDMYSTLRERLHTDIDSIIDTYN